MKSKASLVLMEQVVMILVFSLAAALCLQAFALCDRLSGQSQDRDRAVLVCQNAVEILEHCSGDFSLASSQLGGSWNGTVWETSYDENWNPAAGQPAYVLRVTPQDSGVLSLGMAQAEVCSADGKLLFSLPAAWQKEVSPDGA